MTVYEGRPPPESTVTNCPACRLVAVQHVGTVTLDDEEIGESGYELGDARPRSVDFHRHRDRVAVVLDEVDHWKLEIAGRIEGLPELTLRGCAFSRTHEDDLVLLEGIDHAPKLGDQRNPVPRLRGADRLKELRAGGRRQGHDVEFRIGEMGRHLSAGAVRIGLGADRAEKVVQGSLPEREHQ